MITHSTFYFWKCAIIPKTYVYKLEKEVKACSDFHHSSSLWTQPKNETLRKWRKITLRHKTQAAQTAQIPQEELIRGAAIRGQTDWKPQSQKTKQSDHMHHQIRSDQSLSHVRLFATPWIAARQASLSITNSRSSLTTVIFLPHPTCPSHNVTCTCLLLRLASMWLLRPDPKRLYRILLLLEPLKSSEVI